MGEAETMFLIKQLESDVTELKKQQPAQESQIETVALELQSLHVKIDALETKVDALDVKIDNIDHKLSGKIDSLESRVSHVEQTMATKFELSQLRHWLDDKFAETNKRFELLETELRGMKTLLEKIAAKS